MLDYGHKWARLVDLLDGRRTEHMIKNRFHSLLACSRKLVKNKKECKYEAKLIKALINELKKKRVVGVNREIVIKDPYIFPQFSI